MAKYFLAMVVLFLAACDGDQAERDRFAKDEEQRIHKMLKQQSEAVERDVKMFEDLGRMIKQQNEETSRRLSEELSQRKLQRNRDGDARKAPDHTESNK